MFSEIESYREDLEIKHLRTKNHFVLGLLSVMMIMTLIYMLVTGFPTQEAIALFVGFLLVIIFNVSQLAFGREDYHFYQLNKYISTLGVYVLAIAIIFIFESPSAITALFVAYAISAFYQDLKVMLISNLFLLFTVIMIMLNYPEYLDFQNSNTENEFGIAIFFFAFIMILTVSSFIIIKQKRFFYNQIALSKETEFRNIELIIDLHQKTTKAELPVESYYQKTSAFLEAISKKIGVENAFSEKLKLLLELEKGSSKNELMDKYPTYSKEELERLENLLISGKHKLRKSAIKMGHTFNVEVKKREIFSETHFKSFNHQTDHLDVKIIAFAIFYSALKRGIPGLPPLNDQVIRNTLTSTDYYYYVDPKVIRIYERNSEVFDAIADDVLLKKVKS